MTSQASWTVQDTRSHMDENNLEALLKVVDEPDNEELFPRQREPFVARAGGYTKATQVFVPPPLTPGDVTGTPVKDPMESFNAWARGQTPTSNRNSPTPTGGYVPMSRGAGHTPSSANRHLNMGLGGTPAKMGGTPVRGGPDALTSIQEHRRQLLQQMEELEMQENELRQRQPTPYGSEMNMFSVQGRQQQQQQFSSQGLNPFAPSFGAAPAQPQMTAESIRGRVYETAKDQHGCRFLQRALDSNFDREMAQVIMSEIVPYVPELMTDQYANFLVQKLFDMMPHDVRFNVAKVAAPQMPMIALTPHGTFSVQKLIETITTREEMLVVRDALSADVVRLVVDVHGNHVIQKVLQRFDHPDKQFIYDAVSTDCASIAMNKQGCCVLQRCLEYASPEQHKALVSTILDAALDMVEDPYGNYVVQYVLESDEVEINDRIGLMFLPAISRLAVNKFSSNVMERVLRRTSQHVKDKYCEALCDLNVATRLLSDDYGNYVVQTALTTGSPLIVDTLTQTIRPVLHTIRNAPYAKKLEAKMDMIGRKKFSPTSHNRGQGGFRNQFPPMPPFAQMPGMDGTMNMGGMMMGGPMGDVSASPLTPYHQGPMQQRGQGGNGNVPMMTAAQRNAIDAAMVDAIGGGPNNSSSNYSNNSTGTHPYPNQHPPQHQHNHQQQVSNQPSKYTATSQMISQQGPPPPPAASTPTHPQNSGNGFHGQKQQYQPQQQNGSNGYHHGNNHQQSTTSNGHNINQSSSSHNPHHGNANYSNAGSNAHNGHSGNSNGRGATRGRRF